VLVAAAGLAAIWIGLVSPKRQDAAQLGTKLSVAQTRLGTAQSQLTAAKAAEAGYRDNLRVVKSLYKAVPAGDGVPHLLVSLDKTSHHKRVDFKVITVASVTPGAPAATAPVPGGLSPVSFTFTFNGGYIDLQHFLRSVTRYTLVAGNKVVAHGRLLTIKSVALTPPQASAVTVGGAPVVSGTQAAVTATAYSQPSATSTPSPAAATSTASAPATQTPNTAATVANTTR
jgi:Tfp pilus assembly protein PilO